MGVLGQGLSRTSFSIVMTAKTSDEAVLEIRMGGFSPNVNVLQCSSNIIESIEISIPFHTATASNLSENDLQHTSNGILIVQLPTDRHASKAPLSHQQFVTHC